MKSSASLAVVLASLLAGCAGNTIHGTDAPAASSAIPGQLNWGDQGDGTYKNPVLKADFSDPDLLRVGNDFYLIASDFHYVGMQVLRSTDLVNWQIIGQVFSKLTMASKYDEMKGYGEGTWAPSLRFHNDEFYIYVCTPHDGLFMWHTKNPAGPWSDTVTVKAVDSWEDPCPFWDDDGQAYLVHSKKGAGPLILHRMSADGTRLLDDGRQIYAGKNSEGPKFYKRHGYYYISLPEGGVSTGSQVMLRAKNIYGPYERKEVLVAGSPHQGGLVDLDNGESWFIAFKSDGWQGRRCYLEPVKWGRDDWPIFGDEGHAVLGGVKPRTGVASAPSRPAVSDDFHETALLPVWQWNHNPVNEAWSLADAPGFLRLNALPAIPADMLAYARNTLTQKLWDDYGVIDVTLSTSRMTDGQRAGLTFISGNEFACIAVESGDGIKHLLTISSPPKPKSTKAKTTQPSTHSSAPTPPPRPGPTFKGPEVGETVTLRATYEKDGTGRFSYSTDGVTFQPIAGKALLHFADWKGARIGLFSYGPTPGAADFSHFNYRYFSTKEDLVAAESR
jgi:beta-xylosidase